MLRRGPGVSFYRGQLVPQNHAFGTLWVWAPVFFHLFLSLYRPVTHLTILAKRTDQISCTDRLTSSVSLKMLLCTPLFEQLPTSVDILGCSYLCCRYVNKTVSCTSAARRVDDRWSVVFMCTLHYSRTDVSSTDVSRNLLVFLPKW